MKPTEKYTYETICVKELDIQSSGQSHVLPIHATSAFSYITAEESVEVFSGQSTGFVYSRYANPTIEAVENKLART